MPEEPLRTDAGEDITSGSGGRVGADHAIELTPTGASGAQAEVPEIARESESCRDARLRLRIPCPLRGGIEPGLYGRARVRDQLVEDRTDRRAEPARRNAADTGWIALE